MSAGIGCILNLALASLPTSTERRFNEDAGTDPSSA